MGAIETCYPGLCVSDRLQTDPDFEQTGFFPSLLEFPLREDANERQVRQVRDEDEVSVDERIEQEDEREIEREIEARKGQQRGGDADDCRTLSATASSEMKIACR